MEVPVVGDDEIMVDRMIAASQKKGEVALPSYGRELVPYFVPGAEMLSEGDVNANTDVDSLRRNGASFLEAPVPVAIGSLAVQGGSDFKVASKPVNRKARQDGRSGDEGRKGRRRDEYRQTGTASPLRTLKMNGATKHSDESPPKSLPERAHRAPSSPDSDEVDHGQPIVARARAKIASPHGSWTGTVTSSDEAFSKSAPEESGFNLLDHSHGKKSRRGRTRNEFPVGSPDRVAYGQHGAAIFLPTPPASPEPSGTNIIGSAMLPVMFSYNEKWAGPGYTNSPPPSSLPLPRFSMRPSSRGASPMTKEAAACGNDAAPRLRTVAHSAPTSPLRDSFHVGLPDTCSNATVRGEVSEVLHLDSSSSASDALRRILNLEHPAATASQDTSMALTANTATLSLKRMLQLH